MSLSFTKIARSLMARILIPMTGTIAMAETIDYATQIADSLDAKVIVLSVSPHEVPLSNKSIFGSFEESAKEPKVKFEIQSANGAALESTVDYAEKHAVDLIVLGAGITNQFKSSEIRNRSSIPVLLIPFPMFEENCV